MSENLSEILLRGLHEEQPIEDVLEDKSEEKLEEDFFEDDSSKFHVAQPNYTEGLLEGQLYSFFGTGEFASRNLSENQIKDIIAEQISERDSKNFQNIEKNLVITDRWPYNRRWFIGDSACPLQIRSSSNPSKTERKRFPDAISIGVAKSGTGSIAFLDCHSKIRFRAVEPDAFPLMTSSHDASGIYRDRKPLRFLPLDPKE